MTTYTTTKTTSWFERLGNSFGGIIFGLILFVAGTALLWWNEGNFVKTQAALNEAQGVTRSLEDIKTVDSENNGQLIHAVGLADTQDILEDAIFGVSTSAIRLERSVEYYQWVEDKKTKTETKRKIGGSEETTTATSYSYKKEWVSEPVSSSRFGDSGAPEKYKNTVITNLEDFKVQAQNVTFGAFRLPKFLINSIGGSEPFSVELSRETLDTLNQKLAPAAPVSAAPAPAVPTAPVSPIPSVSQSDSRKVGDFLRKSLSVSEKLTYLDQTEAVTFGTVETVDATPATDSRMQVVTFDAFDTGAAADEKTEVAGGTLSADSLTRTVTADAAGVTDVTPPAVAPVVPALPQMVHLDGSTIYLGLSPAKPEIGDIRVSFKRTLPTTVSLIAKQNGDTFEEYRAKNGKTVRILKVGTHSAENLFGAEHASNSGWTWILRFVGFLCIYLGLSAIVAPLKVLADVIPLLGTIVGVGTGIVCFLFGMAWTLVVIAVAWLFFRPIIGVIILAAAVGLLWMLYKKGKNAGEQPEA